MSMQYVIGGTMMAQSGSYIVRDADRVLRERLLLGEFCYVLTPRQMGKSSLMVQTAFALREHGVASAILDLSKQGYNLDRAQWYNGLLELLGERLGLEEEMEAFCQETASSSSLQRWQGALRRVVLENIAGPVVVFVDEIDITRRLGFETDEFFAAIRSFYNARADDPAYRRLTFCLLGVATPADLIRDPLLTPFNIGTRIDLSDFTFTEAAALKQGLGKGEVTNQRLMERIYHWTNGHPYLTQRLCQAIAQDSSIQSPLQVDHCCRELFLNPKAGATEDNLAFVRRRLAVEDSEHRATLLTFYQQVLAGKPITDTDANSLVAELKLSGVVRAEKGLLKPRNRIYHNVFDRRWITENMPDAELRRQRAAYRRGVLRTSLVSLFVFLLMAALVSAALIQYQEAEKVREKIRQVVYTNTVGIALRPSESGNTGLIFKALEGVPPAPNVKDDLRGFEWRLAWQQLQEDRHVLPCPELNLFAVAVSPDGRFIAAGGQAKTGTTSTVHVWERATRRELPSFSYPGEVNCLVFAPDSKTLAAGGGTANDTSKPAAVYLWNVAMPQNPPVILPAPQGTVNTLAFLDGGKSLVVSGTGTGGTIKFWNLDTRQERPSLLQANSPVHRLALSHDNRTLVSFANGSESNRGHVDLWNLPERRLIHTINSSDDLFAMAFSPDNHLLAMSYKSGNIELWDTKTWEKPKPLNNPEAIYSIAFSPDGKTLAAACWDTTIRLWEVASGKPLRVLHGHVGHVNSVAYTPDDKTLISGGNDGTVRVWDVDPPVEKLSTGGPVCMLVLSEDGKTLATTDGEKKLRLWDTTSGHTRGTLPDLGRKEDDNQFRFMQDGRMQISMSWLTWNSLLGEHLAEERRKSAPKAESLAHFLKRSHRINNVFSAAMQDLLLDRCKISGSTIPQINGLALSPDGDTIAVFGPDSAQYGDGTLELWSLRSQSFLGAVRGAHQNHITAMAFSRDGKSVATGGWDQKVRLWEVSRIRRTLDGRAEHRTLVPREIEDLSAQVWALAFTQDNKTLAVGMQDGKISLCNPERQEVIGTLGGHRGAVTSLAFSSDDNLLVSGSVDKTDNVRFWRAAPFKRTDDPVRVKWFQSLKR